MASSHTDTPDQVSLAADIVAAYVSNNSVPTGGLADLIYGVHSALTKLGPAAAAPEPEPLVPAVSIRKSITPEFLICLDDGKKFKSLKRHLSTLGLTADQYRTKWGLPESYPMVAPNYAAARSALAKSMGLGKIRTDSAKRKPGRKPKAVAEKAAS